MAPARRSRWRHRPHSVRGRARPTWRTERPALPGRYRVRSRSTLESNPSAKREPVSAKRFGGCPVPAEPLCLARRHRLQLGPESFVGKAALERPANRLDRPGIEPRGWIPHELGEARCIRDQHAGTAADGLESGQPEALIQRREDKQVAKLVE